MTALFDPDMKKPLADTSINPVTGQYIYTKANIGTYATWHLHSFGAYAVNVSTYNQFRDIARENDLDAIVTFKLRLKDGGIQRYVVSLDVYEKEGFERVINPSSGLQRLLKDKFWQEEEAIQGQLL